MSSDYSESGDAQAENVCASIGMDKKLSYEGVLKQDHSPTDAGSYTMRSLIAEIEFIDEEEKKEEQEEKKDVIQRKKRTYVWNFLPKAVVMILLCEYHYRMHDLGEKQFKELLSNLEYASNYLKDRIFVKNLVSGVKCQMLYTTQKGTRPANSSDFLSYCKAILIAGKDARNSKEDYYRVHQHCCCIFDKNTQNRICRTGKCSVEAFDPWALRKIIMGHDFFMFGKKRNLSDAQLDSIILQNASALFCQTYQPCFPMCDVFDRYFSVHCKQYTATKVDDWVKEYRANQRTVYHRGIDFAVWALPNDFEKNEVTKLTALTLLDIFFTNMLEHLGSICGRDVRFDLKKIMIFIGYLGYLDKQKIKPDDEIWANIRLCFMGVKCNHCMGIYTQPFLRIQQEDEHNDFLLFLNIRMDTPAYYIQKAPVRFILYNVGPKGHDGYFESPAKAREIFQVKFIPKIESERKLRIKSFNVLVHGREDYDYPPTENDTYEHSHAQIIINDYEILDPDSVSEALKDLETSYADARYYPPLEHEKKLTPIQGELGFDYVDLIRKVEQAKEHGSFHSKTLFKINDFSDVNVHKDNMGDGQWFTKLMIAYCCLMFRPDFSKEVSDMLKSYPFVDKNKHGAIRYDRKGVCGVDDIWLHIGEISEKIISENKVLSSHLLALDARSYVEDANEKFPYGFHIKPYLNTLYAKYFPKAQYAVSPF